MVELLSSCPTNWGVSAKDALSWIEEHMLPVYPLGDYKIHPALDKNSRS
jgi:2-oxoglutarate ferredoxin oxidoreductase subunit beta